MTWYKNSSFYFRVVSLCYSFFFLLMCCFVTVSLCSSDLLNINGVKSFTTFYKEPD